MNFSNRELRKLFHFLVTSAALVLVLQIPLGCSSNDDGPTNQPSPEDLGCLDYTDHNLWNLAPLASTGPSWFRQAWDVEIVDDLAYVAGGQRGLHIFDVSDPGTPQLLSTLPMSFRNIVYDIEVLGPHAYLVGKSFNTDGIVYVCDITDPYAPRWITSIEVPYAKKITLSWPNAFVACRGAGIKILNIIQPGSIKIVGELESEGSIYDIAVSNGLAYLAGDTDGLMVVDISNSADPRLLTTLDGVHSRSITIDGRYAYTIDYSDGLRVYDLTNAQNPSEIASLPIKGWDIEVADNYAFVVDPSNPNYILKVLDVTSPQSPTLISSVPLFRGQSSSLDTPCYLDLDNGKAFVAFNHAGLQVIDISSPNSPEFKSHFKNMGDPFDIAIDNDLAYVLCDRSGLKIFDLAVSVHSPPQVGFLELEGSAVVIEIRDNLAYMIVGRGLVIADISNTADLSIVGTLEANFHRDMAIQNNYAYLANYYNGLAIVDISTPTAPVEVGRIDTPNTVNAVVVSGDFAFVALEDEGLQIIDISDATSPQLVATLEIDRGAEGIALLDNKIYVGNLWGFTVVDISDPNEPVILGSNIGGHGGGNSILLSGGFSYIRKSSQLALYDLSVDEEPVKIGYTSLPGFNTGPKGMAFYGDYLLSTSGDNVYSVGGVTVLWRHCDDSNRATLRAPTFFQVSWDHDFNTGGK